MQKMNKNEAKWPKTAENFIQSGRVPPQSHLPPHLRHLVPTRFTLEAQKGARL